MGLLTRMLQRDFLVYWHKTGLGRNGLGIFRGPVEYPCRWQDGAVNALKAQEEHIVAATTAFVGVDLVLGSLVWHGRLADLPTLPRPLYEITSLGKIPTLRYKGYLRPLGLSFYRENIDPDAYTMKWAVQDVAYTGAVIDLGREVLATDVVRIAVDNGSERTLVYMSGKDFDLVPPQSVDLTKLGLGSGDLLQIDNYGTPVGV